MRVRRVRCPLCGQVVWDTQIEREHSLETFAMTSRGKAHGFKFEKKENPFLRDGVIAKIRRLYYRFCLSLEPIFPTVKRTVFPSLTRTVFVEVKR